MAPKKYEQAIEELQGIVRDLQQNAINMDQLPERLKRADELIRFCRERLRQVESQIEGLFEDQPQSL